MAQQLNIFARILIPFCAGIAVFPTVPFAKLNLLTICLCIFTFLLILVFNYLYVLIKVYRHKTILGILLQLLFFLMGGAYQMRHHELANFQHFSRFQADDLRIFVSSEPQFKGGIFSFKARVTERIEGSRTQRTIGHLLVRVKAESASSFRPEYGQIYLIPASYTRTPTPLNPGEFDSSAWLAGQRIYHQIFLSPQELVRLRGQRGSGLIRFALSLRKTQVNLYRKLLVNDEAFAVAATLILGYRSDLDPGLLDSYAKTGTIHALSVSGMHVGIVYLVLEFCLKWMNRNTLLKWVKTVLILSLIWFYTLLTGCSPSVLRSAIMLSLFVMAKSLRKEPGSYHILFFSAFCLLISDTALLWDPGFQLSYLAVFGLVWLQPQLYQCITFRWTLCQRVWQMVTLSLAAQILTYPMSVYYFHQFPLYFILSNLFIALPVTLLMYAGLAILLFRLYWLAPVFEWVIMLMNKGLEEIASLPYSTINQIWLSKLELLVLILSLFYLLTGIARRHKQNLMRSMLLFILLEGMLARDHLQALVQQKIIMFSLSRHYAGAFINGRHAVVITDLQPSDQAFKFHLKPALDQLKVIKISCISWNMVIDTSHRQTIYSSLLVAHHPLQVAHRQLQFGGYKVLLADTLLNYKRLAGTPRFDAIWVHGSPMVLPVTLMEDVNCRLIWLDGSNIPLLSRKYMLDSTKFRYKTIVLNKNKAYLVNLK